MQIQEGINGSLHYRPTVDPDTGFTILSISAMSAYRNKSHEEVRWDFYDSRSEPMAADNGPPVSSASGIGVLPPGSYYLVPASQWAPPPFVTPLVFCASPPATIIHQGNVFQEQAQNHPLMQSQQQPQQLEQQQQQQLPNRTALLKPSHPFGRLPQAQQPYFKDTKCSSSNAPLNVGRASPLLVPSRPVLRGRRPKPQAQPPVIWDEPPPPELFVRTMKNPRSLFITPDQISTPLTLHEQQQGTAPSNMPVEADGRINKQAAQPITEQQQRAAAPATEQKQQTAVPTPKVTAPDYYIQPSVDEIRDRHLSTTGGYCHRVDNFVVGRKQHGEIRFIGRTDVRGLDVCDIVQFDKNQVFVYMDESKKPAVGDGLNKPAEVTLFNIHWSDKPPAVDNTEQRQQQFEIMLRDEAQRQGAHFICYDAELGEWKFLVDHFSKYGLHL